MIFDRFAFLYVDHRVPIFWKIIESQGIGVGQKIVLDFWKKIFVTHTIDISKNLRSVFRCNPKFEPKIAATTQYE